MDFLLGLRIILGIRMRAESGGFIMRILRMYVRNITLCSMDICP